MAEKSTFKAVDSSERVMYGPRGIVVCGMKAVQQDTLLEILENDRFASVEVVFPYGTDGEKTLKELLALPGGYGRGEHSDLGRAVIMSGLTQAELHRFMSAYKSAGLPKPLWAALTPTSESWKLKDLLDELSAERQAMQNKRSQ